MNIIFETVHTPVVSYVNAAGRMPLVQWIKITNNTGETITDARLELTVETLGQKISEYSAIDLGALSTVRELTQPHIKFDLTALYQIQSQQPGTLMLSLLQGERLLLREKYELAILSLNSWVGESPFEQSAAALAAFVQPQHPRLLEIRQTMNEKLQHSGEVGLSGYQSSQEHVRAMVKAGFEAIQELNINYIDPPASWDLMSNGGIAQRIRTPKDVLEDREGTCLDTSVVFAALLESIGLNPVICLIPGHAFVGYWTKAGQDNGRTMPKSFSIMDYQNFFDGETRYIEIVETTLLCDSSVSFEEAANEARNRMTSSEVRQLEEFGAITNVVAARMGTSRILPLPAVIVTPDGNSETIEYTPVTNSIVDLRENMSNQVANGAKVQRIDSDVPPMVKRWLDDLLDLSLRNPLLNFRWGSASVPILVSENMANYIEDLLQSGKSLSLRPNISLGDSRLTGFRKTVDRQDAVQHLLDSVGKLVIHTSITEDRFQSTLRNMVSSAKSLREETGSNGLYLALGMLAWKPEGREAEITSPLILVPVNLLSRNRGREFSLEIDESSAVTPNFSLVEKLKSDIGLDLKGLVELSADDYGIDVQGTFEYVRQEIIKNNLSAFRVDESVSLGFFNFSSYRLWRDLLDNWVKFRENPLVNHLIYEPAEEFHQPETDSESTDLDLLQAKLPVPSDASQVQAIAKAMAGETFIMQGPPGTGKSQTITNLIAKALHEGKRVLFVAQKKDALDVVRERLEDIHLSPFVLNLHDKGMTPKAVREQIKDVLDIQITSDSSGLETSMNEYINATHPLIAYKRKLYAESKYGISIQGAVDYALNYQSQSANVLPVAGVFLNDWSQQRLEEAKKLVNDLTAIGTDSGNAKTSPWGCAKISRLEARELQSDNGLKDLIEKFFAQLTVVDESTKNIFSKMNLLQIKTGLKLRSLDEYQTRLLGTWTNEQETQRRGEAQQLLDSLIRTIDLLGVATDNLSRVELDAVYAKALKLETGGSFLRTWRLNSLAKNLSKTMILETPVSGFALVTFLEKLKEIRTLANLAKAKALILAGFSNPTLELSKKADAAALHLELDVMTSAATIAGMFGDEFLQLSAAEIASLAQLCSQASDLIVALKADEESTDNYRGDDYLGLKLIRTIGEIKKDAADFSYIQLDRWAELSEVSTSLQKLGLADAARVLVAGDVDFADGTAAFMRGYYEALVSRLLVEQGLNTFDEKSLNRSIERLSNSILAIRDMVPGVLAKDVLDKRGFSSSAKAGRSGELVAAVGMTKSRTPIRTLLSNYWDIVTKVTPCVLAVPDAVVRFLDPANEKFDIVVFDEASQITVPSAIGSMGRAVSAVVVGDSKQMPPTSVAQTSQDRTEDETEDLVEMFDTDSILSMCELSRVPEVMLRWHYRSEDESLIAFSNQRYYGGNLNTFPGPLVDRDSIALSYEYFERGMFNRGTGPKTGDLGPLRTNDVEAKAIVAEIVKRLNDPNTLGESIGIVTFNLQQRKHIEDLLQKSENIALQKALAGDVAKEAIFVKNLETVQGSERDVILFSTAFAKQGGRLPLNFGPLNGAGGARRLNVAITRARKEMKIFTSFRPADIDLSRTSSEGLTHLKEFMNLVLEGPSSIGIETRSSNSRDIYRFEIAEGLRASGLEVDEGVGMSDFKVDIAIKNPDKPEEYLVALLLDGPGWGSRKTALDRDVAPRLLLRDKMKWPLIEIIWMPAWLRDKSSEIERIIKVVELGKSASLRIVEKKQIPAIQTMIIQNSAAEITDLGTDPLSRLLGSRSPFKTSIVSREGTAADLDYDINNADKMRKLAARLIADEGPVSIKRFAKFVSNCYGLQRVTELRVAQVAAFTKNVFAIGEDGFVFISDPKTFDSWKKSDNEPRDLNEVSYEEISNAMLDICRELHGISVDDLVRETSRVFGALRTTQKAIDRLREVVEIAVKQHKLNVENDYAYAVKEI